MAKMVVSFNLNGDAVDIMVQPEMTLLEALREVVGLTSPKCGCNHGDCGSCTVWLEGKAVKSCTVLAATVAGKSVVTLGGISSTGELTSVQKAFLEEGAPQCGYCTPGMVMAATAFLEKNPNPTVAEVKEALSGNICRCGGYDKYTKAVMDVAAGKYDSESERSVQNG